METTGYNIGVIGFILGLYRDNGKENGNYRDYRDVYELYEGCTGVIFILRFY